ncbi:MAG: SIMPL domain-containing protein [archaeon]
MIISAMIFSFAFYASRNSTDSLSVTGSANKEVVSDNAKFSAEFSRIVKISALKAGYDQIAKDLVIVKDFLKEQGVDDKDVTISTVSMNENYNYNQNYQTEKEYTLRQQVEVSSSDIDKMTLLSQLSKSVVDKGVIFGINPVQYYYTKLPELRVSLLSDAIKDAQARAQKMAESTGKKVGSLKSAASGVVQVLSSNSLEISDYGTYDTSKINKNVMVTVRAAFDIK